MLIMDNTTARLVALHNCKWADDSLDTKRAVADITLPKIFKDSLAFMPALLRSNLFRPGSGDRATYSTYTELTTYGRTRIEYKGEELRQDDLRVLLAFVKERSGGLVSNVTTFVPRTFCREVLKWPDSSESVKKLRACILRLQDARARIYPGEGGELAVSFISDAALLEGEWSVWLSEPLSKIFAGHPTYLKASVRLGMTDGLASWLYSFLESDVGKKPVDMTRLRAASGSTYEQKEFNRHVRKHLAAFLDAGVLVSFSFNKDGLCFRLPPRVVTG
jgi:hypothetical protein